MARVGFVKSNNSSSNALNLISTYESDGDDDEVMLNVESTKRSLEECDEVPSKLFRTEDKYFAVFLRY